MRCRKIKRSLWQISRLSCYKSHRTSIHTATVGIGDILKDTGARVMTQTPQPSALTFEVEARCSVSVLVHGRLLMLTNSPDHQSSRLYPSPTPWPSRAAHIHAGGYASLLERDYGGAIGRDWLSTVSEQHLSPRPEAWSGSPRRHWRSTSASRMETQYLDR